MCADSLRSSESDFSFRAGDLEIHDLAVVQFRATEAISELFHVKLDLASEDGEIELDKVVGRPGVLRILSPNEDHDRFINGIVKRFEYMGQGVRFHRYECELVPLAWLLGLRKQCRIFQEMSVPDIIKQVVDDAGFSADYLVMETEEYEKREYCVQYRETDLNFIMRLAEEEGIFFFFKHEEEKHVWLFSDKPAAHVVIAGQPEVLVRSPSQMVPGEEFISHLRFGQQMRPGTATLRAFNFKKPKDKLDSEAESDRDTSLEIYDYPGLYVEKGVGDRRAKVRLEELQVSRRQAEVVSVCRRMIPGFRFTVKDHPRPDFNIEFLITGITHVGTQPTALEQEPSATVPEGPLYENTLKLIPQSVPFRPARVTPKPVVEGTQTAIVVGKESEQIETDEFRRVKVHFHWDREGVFNEKASCWLRVNQAWAGGKYGALFTPRVSHEVIVDFLEGDPDQPIVVGCVYNGDEKPPYGAEDEKTISTLKTANYKDQDGANELRFEDKKGSEQVFLHAERDLHIRAKRSRRVNIQGSAHETIGGEYRETVCDNRSRTVKGDEAIVVEKTRSIHVTDLVSEDFQANHSEAVGGDYLLDVAGKVLIKAGAGLRLEGPGGSITINGGVYIKGSTVYINSGDSPIDVVAGMCVAPAEPAAANKETPGKDTSYTGETRPQKTIPTEELEEKSWITIELKDSEGKPVIGEYFRLKTDDGRILDGTLDVNGQATRKGIEPGTCQVSFPLRYPEEWKRA